MNEVKTFFAVIGLITFLYALGKFIVFCMEHNDRTARNEIFNRRQFTIEQLTDSTKERR